jgi:hypothetical protein
MDAAAVEIEIQVVFVFCFLRHSIQQTVFCNWPFISINSPLCSLEANDIHILDTDADCGSNIFESDNCGADYSKESNELVNERKSVSTLHFHLYMIKYKWFLVVAWIWWGFKDTPDAMLFGANIIIFKLGN